MNTLRKDLRPDFATAEKLYPLVLKRLRDYDGGSVMVLKLLPLIWLCPTL